MSSGDGEPFWVNTLAAFIQYSIGFQAVDDFNGFNEVYALDGIACIPALLYEGRGMMGGLLAGMMGLEWSLFLTRRDCGVGWLCFRFVIHYIWFMELHMVL